jgi:hypothetical protein
MNGLSMIRRGTACGFRTARIIVAMILVMAAQGCSSRTAGYPPLGDVTGVLTNGGQPVPSVTVLFQPTAGGRASVGVTDSAGRYTLRYTEAADGAVVGDHTVTLSQDPDESDPMATMRTTKGLDRKFSFTVKQGRQTFDIEIAGD